VRARARVRVCVHKIDSKDCTSRTPGRKRDLDKKRDFYLGGASYCYDHENIKRDYLATRSRLKRSPINIIARVSSRATRVPLGASTDPRVFRLKGRFSRICLCVYEISALIIRARRDKSPRGVINRGVRRYRLFAYRRPLIRRSNLNDIAVSGAQCRLYRYLPHKRHRGAQNNGAIDSRPGSSNVLARARARDLSSNAAGPEGEGTSAARGRGLLACRVAP